MLSRTLRILLTAALVIAADPQAGGTALTPRPQDSLRTEAERIHALVRACSAGCPNADAEQTAMIPSVFPRRSHDIARLVLTRLREPGAAYTAAGDTRPATRAR